MAGQVLDPGKALMTYKDVFWSLGVVAIVLGVVLGLFSFLLAYNDFAVTSMLLSRENLTMVPKIESFLGTTQTRGNVMFAVASVVSVTLPLFLLVMFFQRQIVAGMAAGAVKG